MIDEIEVLKLFAAHRETSGLMVDSEWHKGYTESIDDMTIIFKSFLEDIPSPVPTESAPVSDIIANCEHVHTDTNKHEKKCLDCGADLPYTIPDDQSAS